MNKIVLGLDLGIASVGWCLINETTGKVISSGVRIFPRGTHYDDKSKKETPKNAVRRAHRGRSRNIYRFKMRRKRLRNFLDKAGMLPEYHIENKDNKNTKIYYGKEFYQTRTTAIDEKIELRELGRIFMFFNKHRGFKSNSLSRDLEDDESGKVKKQIGELQSFIEKHQARTLGEYFHKMYQLAEEWYNEGKWHNVNEPIDERAFDAKTGEYDLHSSYGIRREGRYVARSMYENEFDIIWSAQKSFYEKELPELFTGSKQELKEIEKLSCEERRKKLKQFFNTPYWKLRNNIIFYQRPLRSQKKYIGRCSLEPSKRRTPISSLLYQEFRIWKEISDIRYTEEENSIFKKPLPLDWKRKAAGFLAQNEDLDLKLKKDNLEQSIFGVLQIEEPDNFQFVRTSTESDNENKETQEKIKGNKTVVALKNALPKKEFLRLLRNQKVFEENSGTLSKEEKGRTLYHLWHLFHMSNQPEWLKEKLMCDWDYNDAISSNLLEVRLEDGYASLSAKAIKKLLPEFKLGKDEWGAKNSIPEYQVHSDLNSKQENLKKLRKKVSPIINNELRNPVVERSVSETIKIVNKLLIEYESLLGNRSDFNIRIEATRNLRKPKSEREKNLRKNQDADKRRVKLAKFINANKPKFELKRNVAKYDSLINKYELFLELGGDPNDEHYLGYLKGLKSKDRLKHKLWLECKRLCPYSMQPIPLHKLFTDAIEIEHIIPYSISWDDSYMNKTLSYRESNAAKANNTAAAYMKSIGKLGAFKAYLKKTKFPKPKLENCKKLVIEEGGLNGSALSNTSYIATAVRKKLAEVCLYENVSFTNGQATGLLRRFVWRDLGRLLDVVRFEEETGIAMEPVFDNFRMWSREFHHWRKKKHQTSDLKWLKWRTLSKEESRDLAAFDKETGNSLEETWNDLSQFYDFQNSNGKKDRTDHRHHTLDAFFVASTSEKVLQRLNNWNRTREIEGENFHDSLRRLDISDCPYTVDCYEVKDSLKKILVSFRTDQKLLALTWNKFRTADGKGNVVTKIQGSKPKKGRYSKFPEEQFTGGRRPLQVRKSLHEDNPYGLIKNSYYENEEEMERLSKKERKEKYFVKRGTFDEDFKSKNVIDKKARESIESTNLKKDKVWMYSTKGKKVPIKKIRTWNKDDNRKVEVRSRKAGTTLLTQNYNSEGNYLVSLYQSLKLNKKGEIVSNREFRVVNIFEAVEKKLRGQSLFSDEFDTGKEILGLNPNCPFLRMGDSVLLFAKNAKIDFESLNIEEQWERLYYVKSLSFEPGYARIVFLKHNVSAHAEKVSKGYSFGKKHCDLRHTQINALKVQVNLIGNEIRPINQ